MLNAIPKHWFSWDFRVMDGTRQVAEMDLTFWRRKGTLSVEGIAYEVFREGLVSGAYVLEAGGAVAARAEKPSAFRRTFLIEHAGRQLTLRARSASGRAFDLYDGPNEIGTIAPEGFLTRRAAVRLPEELPLPVRIFILWLVIIIWRREADSGGSGA